MAIEKQYIDQLSERNNLLLALWNRLSTLCGADFMQKNSLVDDQLPSVEVISRNLAGFSRNMNLAVRTVEVLVGGFRSRIRDVEKSLWKDFQTLEHAIEVRTKRIDHLEKMVAQQTKERLESAPPAPAPPSASSSATLLPTSGEERGKRSVSRSSSRSGHTSRSEEITKLQNQIKLLKAELQFARGQSPSRPPTRSHSHRGSVDSGNSITGILPGIGGVPRSPPGVTSIPPRDSSHRASMTSTLMRHHSTSAVEGYIPPADRDRDQQKFQRDQALPGLQESPTRRTSSFVTASQIPSLGTNGQPIQVLNMPIQPLQPSEQRWIHRLKELERRLKAEREARLLDRSGARKRLEEGKAENEELRLLLERERERGRASLDGVREAPGFASDEGQDEGGVD
jgi:hypothetical protein